MGTRGPKPKRREVVWSPELAYAIGLMATDGSLSIDGRHLDFTSNDKEQIRRLMKCFDLKGLKIGTKRSSMPRRNESYRVQWGNVRLYDFLLSVGLTPNKTKTIGCLAIPDAYFFDFLRGHFDGDGSFFSYFDPRWKSSFMYYLSFVPASSAHIEWLQSQNEHLIGVRGHVTRAKGCSLIQLKYAKRESTLVLARLYADPTAPHLKRKRLKIVKALHIVGQALPDA